VQGPGSPLEPILTGSYEPFFWLVLQITPDESHTLGNFGIGLLALFLGVVSYAVLSSIIALMICVAVQRLRD